MHDLSKALDFAHKNKVFHHDLKDKNGFTCETKDNKPQFKLGDWGSSVRLE